VRAALRLLARWHLVQQRLPGRWALHATVRTPSRGARDSINGAPSRTTSVCWNATRSGWISNRRTCSRRWTTHTRRQTWDWRCVSNGCWNDWTSNRYARRSRLQGTDAASLPALFGTFAAMTGVGYFDGQWVVDLPLQPGREPTKTAAGSKANKVDQPAPKRMAALSMNKTLQDLCGARDRIRAFASRPG
jgi:hypothetical protein